MPHVYTLEENYEDIADAIRAKLGVQTTYKPGEMAAAIDTIASGGTIGDFGIISGEVTPPSTASQVNVMSYSDFLEQVGGSMPTNVYAGIFDPLVATGGTGVAYIFGKQGFQSSVKYFNGGNLVGSALANNRIFIGDFGFFGSGVMFNGYNSTYGGFQAGTTYIWFVLWSN